MSLQRSGFILKLAKMPWIHNIVNITRTYNIANYILMAFPIYKQINKRGIVVRINSVAAMALSEEILGNAGYTPSLRGYEVNTFIDLGCNIGWLPCIIASLQQVSDLKGLMIDADPSVLDSARWHLRKNNLTGCTLLQGAVGCPKGKQEIILNITGSNTQSSIRDFSTKHPYPLKGKTRSISVPCISVSEAWKEKFQDQKVDLLKIDIEGSELDFLKGEIAFVSSMVRRVVCEWHSWHVNFNEIQNTLTSNGFSAGKITEQDDKGGVAYFNNLIIESK